MIVARNYLLYVTKFTVCEELDDENVIYSVVLYGRRRRMITSAVCAVLVVRVVCVVRVVPCVRCSVCGPTCRRCGACGVLLFLVG